MSRGISLIIGELSHFLIEIELLNIGTFDRSKCIRYRRPRSGV